jgi:hypothetical protein
MHTHMAKFIQEDRCALLFFFFFSLFLCTIFATLICYLLCASSCWVVGSWCKVGMGRLAWVLKSLCTRMNNSRSFAHLFRQVLFIGSCSISTLCQRRRECFKIECFSFRSLLLYFVVGWSVIGNIMIGVTLSKSSGQDIRIGFKALISEISQSVATKRLRAHLDD